ncbi:MULTISPECIES: hypothetical protein [Geobacter]|uniref:Magnetosome protein MamS/MamX domain-containing protein n=2 Tax=Geobacter TaxID=28231 RepID=A0A0C1TZX2_9BACT|nr:MULTISPECIES: hypothetical protein [Geobacter]ANA39389.1 hypothetical protein A2G06_02180 [Geobacter anodireducens]KIE41165.1 hypothetical protein SE37_00210 [Geobacter soli]MBE2886401.1 hypothetical protein [Geobacter anodireducens]HMN01758.1 hypothetical protein [Geobacter anodireducens]
MNRGRSTLILTILVLLALFHAGNATAGWGFGFGWGWEKSGLDLDEGYDLNTVVTVTGTIASVEPGGNGTHMLVTIKEGEDTVVLALGPRWYWNENGFPLKPGDRLTARGAKAIGKDGTIYLLTQKVGNSSTGGETVIRSDAGRPFWSGSGRGNTTRPTSPVRRGGGRHGR